MNTILITVDALRADHLGQYGYDRDTMPVLDRLSDGGTRFENAFANGPYTRISIPSIHTSVRLAHSDLDSFPTISGRLNASGIDTACIGTRTGFKSAEGDLHFDTYVTLGRDDYHDESQEQQSVLSKLEERVTTAAGAALKSTPRLYNAAQRAYDLAPTGGSFSYKGYTSAAEVTDTTLEWLSEQDGDFFLWLHYMEGHRPYGVHDTDPEYTDPVDNDRIRELMKKAGTEPENVTADERKLLVDLYDSDLRYCSQHLDRLVDGLEELGIWDTTNLVFTSDHGEEFGEHGYYFHRNLPYDELLHVPLLVRSPATADQPETIAEQRELIDIAPTILDFHDATVPDVFEGQNLFTGDSRNVISSGSQSHPTPAISARWDGYKYLYTPDQEYLFDLGADPGQTDNLASELPDICDDYRSQIPEMYFDERATKEQLRDPEDEADRERLEALGYLETKS
ncbi:sulfatase [Halopiger xanaduensis]|uniref:Sulfatase n=1 Tax=Halopiger xanaduensis (strain DSM 18323 / JCM 14033 / SH-6) TaxID=797210 RepID=F8DEL3_HALXS|nr:sulfatase [Halopiger xanaduensis]AEH39450.1 sulfatase [Halopiger xanaduensis SH-6]